MRRQREADAYLETAGIPEKVVPARSASHRAKEEARLRDAPFLALPEEPASEKKRKKRKKHRRKSPSPDVRRDPRDRRPPSSDGSDNGGDGTDNRHTPKEEWCGSRCRAPP